jgi:hypothetical protein
MLSAGLAAFIHIIYNPKMLPKISPNTLTNSSPIAKGSVFKPK